MSKAKIGFMFGAALVALSTQVSAATGCNGDGSNQTIASGSFVINSFTMKCSSNVYLGYAESSTNVVVCSGSKKGASKFFGTSDGGQVTATAISTPLAAVPSISAGATACP